MGILKAVSSDADSIVDLRMRLFRELGETDDTGNHTELEEATRQYFSENLNKNLICWVSVMEEKVIASASLCLFSRMPYNGNLAGKEAYILNIYTLPEYRRQGIAAKMMEEIITYAKAAKIKKLWLNASEQGKKIYSRCGFSGRADCMDLYL